MSEPLQSPASMSIQREEAPRHSTHVSSQDRYAKGVVFCMIATVSFGLMFPVMTSALTRIDPFTFTSLRYLIAGTAFLLLLRVKEGASAFRLKGEPVILAWILGSIGFAGFGFFVFLGQQLAGRDGALTASIMMATQPMLGLVVNSVVRRILPPLYSFLFMVLSLCGVALVVTKGDVIDLLSAPQNYSANALIMLGRFLLPEDRGVDGPRFRIGIGRLPRAQACHAEYPRWARPRMSATPRSRCRTSAPGDTSSQHPLRQCCDGWDQPSTAYD
jgi:EamA-like transporter family